MPSRPVTDQQVQRYMYYRQQHPQAIAAAKAGMSERTARKFERDPKLPSQRKVPRHWRTRRDPLAGLWDEVVHRCSRPIRACVPSRSSRSCRTAAVPSGSRRRASDTGAACAQLARPTWPRPGGVLPSGASAGPDGAVGLHRRRRARCHDRRHGAQRGGEKFPCGRRMRELCADANGRSFRTAPAGGSSKVNDPVVRIASLGATSGVRCSRWVRRRWSGFRRLALIADANSLSCGYNCTFRSCVFIYCASLPVVMEKNHFEGLPMGVRSGRQVDDRLPGDDVPRRCDTSGREHLRRYPGRATPGYPPHVATGSIPVSS